MRTSISLLFERAIERYWIIPSAIALGILLLLGVVRYIPAADVKNSFLSVMLFDSSAEGARQLLSAVASALMTVVGVLFSITVVILQQASAQYSPRVIDNFTRSAASQVVLGFYIGTFTYCLILVRQIRGSDSQQGRSVPDAAISVAILLAVICLALLIHYINHIVHAIQSTRIVGSIVRDSIRSIRNVSEDSEQAEQNSHEHSENVLKSGGLTCEIEIKALSSGYLQAHRWNKIAGILCDFDWEMTVQVRPGDYIEEEGAPLATLRTSDPITDSAAQKLRSGFEIRPRRTHARDPRFGFRQLVDIALRSLSPGINDPTTALEALNGISSALIVFTRSRPHPEVIWFHSKDRLRLYPLRYEEVLSLAFDQILSFSSDHPTIRLRMLEILRSCRSATSDSKRLVELGRYEQQVRYLEGERLSS